jgi:formylmethanofuran dehydrogenase subunit E
MNYPKFFDEIEKIELKDELSAFLGAFEKGLVEFSYLDIVKSAGHSCPTVAGAYLMTQFALKELYKDETPKRGEIFVSFKENEKEGVAGVIGNVITQITGATVSNGFKGLNGKFKRFDLMKFNDNITSSVKFTRLDTNESLELIYNPNLIPLEEKAQILMQKMMKNEASLEDKLEFGKLWQNRVKEIFENIHKVIKIV